MAERPSLGFDTESIAKNLNQVIFEREFNPKLSAAENFQKIVDAARNKNEYRSEEFDPLGVSSAKQIKRFTVGDKNTPKLKPIFSNTSIIETASQYDAPVIGEYSVKDHLIEFLINKEAQLKVEAKPSGEVFNISEAPNYK
tara:strand:+ start:1517 stop:1939 length:423 start_codon:yes stop_codon:yes gene_type:complete